MIRMRRHANLMQHPTGGRNIRLWGFSICRKEFLSTSDKHRRCGIASHPFKSAVDSWENAKGRPFKSSNSASSLSPTGWAEGCTAACRPGYDRRRPIPHPGEESHPYRPDPVLTKHPARCAGLRNGRANRHSFHPWATQSDCRETVVAEKCGNSSGGRNIRLPWTADMSFSLLQPPQSIILLADLPDKATFNKRKFRLP